VNVHGYQTRIRSKCQWESHRHAVDLQAILEGCERIDGALATDQISPSEQDVMRDFKAWPENLNSHALFRLEPGMFALLLPGELHRLVLAAEEDISICELVVKIGQEYL